MNRFSRVVALGAIVLAVAPSPLPAKSNASLAPVLAASEGWLNGAPRAESFAGKVVVVDVFTFGCGNCQNVVPNLRKLDAQHDPGLAIIGVHSPETAYEHSRTNVVDSLRAQGITWPVALDNSFSIWNAYGVEAWPTQLVFDRHGTLRKTIVGDSQDDVVNDAVAKLLAEK